MFPADTIACNFVAGFFPIFNGPADCSWEFAVAMVVGGLTALLLRSKKRPWYIALIGGVAAYFVSLGALTLATASPSNQEQFGWFIFLCFFLVPRALLASAIGLLFWEAIYFLWRKT